MKVEKVVDGITDTEDYECAREEMITFKKEIRKILVQKKI